MAPHSRRPTAIHRRSVAVALAVAWAMSGCSSEATSPSSTTVVESNLSVVVDGLEGPTQIVDGPDGLLLVAQLAGGENDATGEVVAIDLASGDRRVIATGLDKPTGVLWIDDTLWVMVRRGLIAAPWSGVEPTAGAFEPVLDELPFNGRSEGTLTALADGRFLYATTGSLAGGSAVPGSGTLWVYEPTDGTSRAIATGLKNAYGHATLDGGTILTTEIGDAADPPVEEVNMIDPTQSPPDFGWPGCPGDDVCSGVTGPLSTFPSAATPTGIATVGDDVYVTLFVTGQLVRISLDGWRSGAPPVESDKIASGLQGPHTVLARPDGTLWISEHLAGRIIAVRPDPSDGVDRSS